MYCVKNKYACEYCQGELDIIRLKEWNDAHPELVKVPPGGSYEFAQKRKKAGYFAWRSELSTDGVTTLYADCHGDSLSLCKKHMIEFVEENWKN